MADYLQQASFLHRQETERVEAARRAQAAEQLRRQRFNRMIDFRSITAHRFSSNSTSRTTSRLVNPCHTYSLPHRLTAFLHVTG